jgi:hypothetical protein
VRARLYALRDRVISTSSCYEALPERSNRYAKVGRVKSRVGRLSVRPHRAPRLFDAPKIRQDIEASIERGHFANEPFTLKDDE